VLDRPIPVTEFCQRLIAAGIHVIPNLTPSGRLLGFSFGLDGVFFMGSDLGRNYGWNGLQPRGVIYEQNRDSEFLYRLQRTTCRLDRRDPADPERTTDCSEKSGGDEKSISVWPGKNRPSTTVSECQNSTPHGPAGEMAKRISVDSSTDSWLEREVDVGSSHRVVLDWDDERFSRHIFAGNRSADTAVGTMANREHSEEGSSTVNLTQDEADQDISDVPTLRM